MADLLYEVGVDPTPLEAGVAAVEARLKESGVRMAEEPEKYAKASAAAFEEVYSSEDRLAKFRKQSAYDRMSDEEKVAVLQHEALGLLNQIQSIEGSSAEKANLQISYEQKKNQIYDLNKKIQSEALAEQQKQTEEQGALNEKGGAFGKILQQVKEGFKSMGVEIKGAGMGLLFAEMVNLGRQAIANAQKLRDEAEQIHRPLDVGTQSLARFGDALDGIKIGAEKSVGFLISGYTQLGDVFGSVINRMRGISEAQENQAEQAQRAADQAEQRDRQIRQEQYDVDKVRAARQALHDAEKAASLENVSSEQKLQVLLAESAKLRDQIKNSAADTVNHVKWEKDLVENEVEVQRTKLELVKEQAEAQLNVIKNQQPLAVTFEEKLQSLLQQEMVYEKELGQLVKGTTDYKEVEAKISANITEQEQLYRDHASKIALDQQTLVELVRIHLGLSTQEVSAQEQLVAKAGLLTQQKETQNKIDERVAWLVAHERNPAEDQTLATLVQQSRELDRQVAKVAAQYDPTKRLNDLAREWLGISSEQLKGMEVQTTATIEQAQAEGMVTTELEKQLAIIKKIIEERDKPPPNDPRNFNGAGSPLGLHDLGGLSTDVLQAQLKQLSDEYNKAVASYVPVGPSVVAGSNGATNNYYLGSQIQSIRDELAFRNDFMTAYSRGGRAGALQQFISEGRDASSFDTAIANMSAWAQGQNSVQQKLDKTNQVLGTISSQLHTSGLSLNPIG